MWRRNISYNKELLLTAVSIAVTLLATFMLAGDLWQIMVDSWIGRQWQRFIPQVLFTSIFFFLIYGNLLYQLTRVGYYQRLRRHRPVPRRELERLFEGPAPTLTMLIPSYKEEIRIIRQALFCCALQEYPNRRVVLLLDDPPAPSDPEDLVNLVAARALPREIAESVSWPRAFCRRVHADSLARQQQGRIDVLDECERLAGIFQEIADWFETQVKQHSVEDHADALFVKLTFQDRIEEFRQRARLIASEVMSLPEGDRLRRFRREYQRLAGLFDVEVTSFERKAFVNLSHAPNKAMNLNSYIGLIGGSFRSVRRGKETLIEPCDAESASLDVPDSDYLLTLDADSLLAPDYALRLIEYMERPEHGRVAVVQTPYSAVPNPPGVLERIAGATTDMQYIVHQGFTKHNATYWVGANALLRKAALCEIATRDIERGYPVTRYIQDRTVIEDTESSVDLILRGWKLHNYPERLSYSATPPDFGSLLIQRRRWANGGLIILGKLLRYMTRTAWRPCAWGESFMRFHYLTSITGVNLGVLLILTYPMERYLRIPWLPLTAVPYFALYGRDMMLAGYRFADLLRVYALNLLLIPVNLGGVFKSIHQLLTGRQIPFGRTPKIAGRTATPPRYIGFESLFILYCLLGAIMDFVQARWGHGVCALINVAFLTYAVSAFIGWREGRQDLLQSRRVRRVQGRLWMPRFRKSGYVRTS